MVISALLGAPEEDEEQLREWTDAMLHIDPGEIMGAHATEHPARNRTTTGRRTSTTVAANRATTS